MKENKYKEKEEEFNKNHSEVDKMLDSLGFSSYRDGCGDYGTRRLMEGNDHAGYKSIHTVVIMDMTPEYYTNEYPDYQFNYYPKEDSFDRIEFNTVTELSKILNSKTK